MDSTLVTYTLTNSHTHMIFWSMTKTYEDSGNNNDDDDNKITLYAFRDDMGSMHMHIYIHYNIVQPSKVYI